MATLLSVCWVRGNNNLGDIASRPLLYVEPPAGYELVGPYGPGSAVHRSFPEDTVVVIGGGGVFDGQMGESRIGRFVEQRKAGKLAAVVFWGVGVNIPNSPDIEYPDYLAEADLVGVRDCDQRGYPFVPCASCLSPAFDVDRGDPRHDIVVYGHCRFGLPKMAGGHHYHSAVNNTFSELGQALDFLASGELVVTNTYHGAYWAILLGRKVIVVDPFSNKFTAMPWQPPVGPSKNWRELAKEAHVYPTGLEECRELNREFEKDFRELLERVAGEDPGNQDGS